MNGNSTCVKKALCFVQFLHPGGEHTPDSGKVKLWNRESIHKRKFVRNRGQFLIDTIGLKNVKTGTLNFWCEWEPDSCVEDLPYSEERGPKFIHTPYFVKPSHYDKHRNTDPFVFGERFLYSNCHQFTNKNSRPTQLRDLADGSVILFGSCIDKGFRIDTVFVVKRSVGYGSDYESVLKKEIKDRENRKMVSEAVIQPLFNELDVGSCSASQGMTYRLYFGATVRDPMYFEGNRKKPMFSFFPARVDDNTKQGFERLQIKMNEVITDTQTQSCKLNRNIEDIYGKWRAVADNVLARNLVLGVQTDLPIRKTVRCKRCL